MTTPDTHSCSHFCNRPECIKTQRDELRSRLAELQRDADRYRWLCQNTAWTPEIADALDRCDKALTDAAIDAAMAAAQQGGV